MTPLDPEEMSPDELVETVDELQEEVVAFEEKPSFRNYLEAKAKQDACAKLLRVRAVEVGNFACKFFQFQKVDKETTDWKSICRHLVETDAVSKKAMEGAIDTFTESKPYGKMVKLKDRDISLKIA
jgi:hypothetical protein|tara:strand:- start:8746 stop:9123 length:378 start_codon:yes stop_codon:yes gene_type:complete